MFGGILAIKNAVEGSYRTLNQLRQNYTRLRELEPDNSLLTALELTEDLTTPSPRPDLLPVLIKYKVTPAFLERYAPSGETLQEKLDAMEFKDREESDMLGGLQFKEEIRRYITDLDAEVRRIEGTGQ